MRIKKSSVLFFLFSLYALLFSGLFFNLAFLTRAIGVLFILFIPGALAYVAFSKKWSVFGFIGLSVLGSYVLNTVAALILSLILHFPLSGWFLFFVSLFATLPSLFLILHAGLPDFGARFEVPKIPLLILLFAFIARVLVFARTNFIIIGSDVGRFGSIAHAMVLKASITPNLVPFEIIQGFFYFPGVIVIPLLFDLAGINALVGASLALLLGNLAFLCFAFLFFSRLFEKQRAQNAFLFFAFAFDFSFLLAVSGIYPYALALAFFMLFLYALTMFAQGARSRFGLVLATTGIALFHWYVGILAALFAAAVACSLVLDKNYRRLTMMVRELIIAASIAAISLVPFILAFGAYISLPFLLQNKADLFSISLGNARSLLDRVLSIFVISTKGFSFSALFVLGFLFLIFDARTLVKKKILGLFLLFLSVFNFFVFWDNNFVRAITVVWLFYAVAFSRALTTLRTNVVIMLFLIVIASPSPLFLAPALQPGGFISSIPIPDGSFYRAMDFIRANVSDTATFLIDGGGAGCVGRSSSYGERIFPLTSRKVWYFTNTCWANYNYTTYSSKVALYNALALNPDNPTVHDELALNGVTHIFIGSFAVGLNRTLFSKSRYYREVFSDANTSIFTLA